MITEIIIFFSAVIISLAIIIASRNIAQAVRPLEQKEKISRDLLGRIKKAQVIHKKDDIDTLLGE